MGCYTKLEVNLILLSHQIFAYELTPSTELSCVCVCFLCSWERVKYECVITRWFSWQGIDTEENEKDSKGDATKLFGANTPTVSCSFDSE